MSKEEKPIVLEPVYNEARPSQLAAAMPTGPARELDPVESESHVVPAQLDPPLLTVGAGATVAQTQSALRPVELQQSKPQVINPAQMLTPKQP